VKCAIIWEELHGIAFKRDIRYTARKTIGGNLRLFYRYAGMLYGASLFGNSIGQSTKQLDRDKARRFVLQHSMHTHAHRHALRATRTHTRAAHIVAHVRRRVISRLARILRSRNIPS